MSIFERNVRIRITFYFELKALKFISENDRGKLAYILNFDLFGKYESSDYLFSISYLKFGVRRLENLCINHLRTATYSIFTE